jgi:hypothetical protein
VTCYVARDCANCLDCCDAPSTSDVGQNRKSDPINPESALPPNSGHSKSIINRPAGLRQKRPFNQGPKCSRAGIDCGLFARFKLTGWMRRFRMVVVQVRSQMVSNYDIPGHGCLEAIFLHVAR